MIWMPCEAGCEEKNRYVCRDEKRAHSFSEEFRDEENGLVVKCRCENCGALDYLSKEDWDAACRDVERQAARRRANLTRYPRIETHTGEIVTSREHEKELTKRMGFHAAEHGVNERFDDETCVKLKEKRLVRDAKKRKLADRRKHFKKR